MPSTLKRPVLISLTVLALVLASTPEAVAATSAVGRPADVAPTASRWHVLFADDFNGPAGSEPNQSYWLLVSGRTYGIATNVASSRNVHLSGNGALEIEAIRQGGVWTSGEVQTKEAFWPGAGQTIVVTAQIKMPSGGQGYWPAFWAVGLPSRTNPNSEPTAGEIDIAETINDDKWVAQVLHCGPRKGGPCHEDERRTNGIGHIHMLSRPSGSSGWNTYGWEWVNRSDNPYIEVTMNGEVQLKVSRDTIGAVTWHQAFDHPWYLIVGLAIGGGWPGPPSSSSAPEGSISIARLRVFRS